MRGKKNCEQETVTNVLEISSELLQTMAIQATTKKVSTAHCYTESELCSLTPSTKGVWAAQLGRLLLFHFATGSSHEPFRGQQKPPAFCRSHITPVSPGGTETAVTDLRSRHQGHIFRPLMVPASQQKGQKPAPGQMTSQEQH